jgi:hypothetical protein
MPSGGGTPARRGEARVREYLRQQDGKCPLYGGITGYRLVQSPGVSVGMDIKGRHVETIPEEFAPTTGTIQFRNKTFEVRRNSMLKIDAAKKEAK